MLVRVACLLVKKEQDYKTYMFSVASNNGFIFLPLPAPNSMMQELKSRT